MIWLLCSIGLKIGMGWFLICIDCGLVVGLVVGLVDLIVGLGLMN